MHETKSETRAGVAKCVNVCYSLATFAGYVITSHAVLSTRRVTITLAYAYKTKERERDQRSEATRC